MEDPEEGGPWSRELEVGDSRILLQVHSGLELARMQCSCDAGPMPCWHMEVATTLPGLPGDDRELFCDAASTFEDCFGELRDALAFLEDTLAALRSAEGHEDPACRAEYVRSAREDVKEAQKCLREACQDLVRLVNGYPPAGERPQKKGWPEGTPWVQRSLKEVQSLSISYSKRWLEECSVQADLLAARPETNGAEPGGGLCCTVALVLFAALLVWIFVL